jgi:hypothetical protein
MSNLTIEDYRVIASQAHQITSLISQLIHLDHTPDEELAVRDMTRAANTILSRLTRRR